MSVRACPLCAEEIQAAATLCRWCGARFLPDGVVVAPGAAPGVHHPPRVAVVPPTAPLSGVAITGFILSLLWLGGAGSLAGLILGYSAKSSIDTGHTSGRGLAVAAIVLGWIGVAAGGLWFILLATDAFYYW